MPRQNETITPCRASNTIMDINESLVRSLLIEQFLHWADLPIRPVHSQGWDNRTFRLGDDMSVRLPSAERYVPQVEKEQRWLPKLALHLPLPIPLALAKGAPGEGYPWDWSIYRWLEGESAAVERIANLHQFATDLAQFLIALHRIDPAGGPEPGKHNFFRGGSLSTYDGETRQAIKALGKSVDGKNALRLWEAALGTEWQAPPVWVHGDLADGNRLIKKGQLCAVIDFGSCGVGDPACDLTIAWTLFEGQSREIFRIALQLDDGTWTRARGWALWKALITLAEHRNSNPRKAAQAAHVIDQVLSDE